jgi:hypothetical protein
MPELRMALNVIIDNLPEGVTGRLVEMSLQAIDLK